MKKQVLIGSALLAAISAFPQSGRPVAQRAGVLNYAAEKSMRVQAGVNEQKGVSPLVGSGQTNGNINYMRPSGGAPTNVSWSLLTGSSNVYGMLVSSQRPLNYNPNVNAVSFISRKSDYYTLGTSIPSGAQSGAIIANISTNLGQSWDSTAIWADGTHWGRYPQGGIWAPPATSFSNAYVVGSGPTVSGSTWTGNFYASKQLNTFNNVPSTTPGAQQFISFTGTFAPNQAQHGWSRNGFSSTDDGLVRSIGVLENDLQGLSTVRGFAVVTGSMNQGVFDWTTDTLVPNTLVDAAGDKYLAPDPYMAWSQDGKIGYVVAQGVLAGTTLSNKGNQPIIWKMDRTNLTPTPTWTQVPSIDFNSPANADVTSHLAGQIVNSGADTVGIPYVNDYDIAVDANGKLHLGCIFMSAASDHPDSLNYISQFTTSINPSELYKWAHTPGQRPYIYDFTTDGLTGWSHILVDSASSEGPSSAVGYPGYAENPWDNAGTGGAKVGMESRLQLGRTPSGDFITFSWTESDSSFTNQAFKWNNLPDIKVRALAVFGNSFVVNSGPEQNMTMSDNNVSVRATLHYMSPVTTSATINSGLNSYTVDIHTPLTVTNSNPYSQLTNNATWYGAAMTQWVFAKPLGVSIAENNQELTGCYIYPNPAKNNAVLAMVANENSTVNVSVLNAVGQVVKSNKSTVNVGENHVNIDLSGLASGIYFVNVKTANSATTKKLVIE